MEKGRGSAASVDLVQEGMEASACSSEVCFHGRVGADQGGSVALGIRVLGGSVAGAVQRGDQWDQVIQGEE